MNKNIKCIIWIIIIWIGIFMYKELPGAWCNIAIFPISIGIAVLWNPSLK